MIQIQSRLKYAKISSQKIRILANHVKGFHVEKAMSFLEFSNKKASFILKKIIHSAIANAENNHNLIIEFLFIKNIIVNQGPTKKKMQPRAKGRGCKILKRSSHITVILYEKKNKRI